MVPATDEMIAPTVDEAARFIFFIPEQNSSKSNVEESFTVESSKSTLATLKTLTVDDIFFYV